jgi:hypothetical protein
MIRFATTGEGGKSPAQQLLNQAAAQRAHFKSKQLEK